MIQSISRNSAHNNRCFSCGSLAANSQAVRIGFGPDTSVLVILFCRPCAVELQQVLGKTLQEKQL